MHYARLEALGAPDRQSQRKASAADGVHHESHRLRRRHALHLHLLQVLLLLGRLSAIELHVDRSELIV